MQKKELSDLLSELTKIIDPQGRALTGKIANFLQLWDSDQRLARGAGHVDIDELNKRIGEINTIDSELLVGIWSRDGIIKKNNEYFDELCFYHQVYARRQYIEPVSENNSSDK